jgi:hypothetical protein
MKSLIRIQQTSGGKTKQEFDLLYGLKNLFKNLKVLFTKELMSNGNLWMKTQTIIYPEVVDDFSLVVRDGKPEFVPTAKGTDIHYAALMITQDLDLEIGEDSKFYVA